MTIRTQINNDGTTTIWNGGFSKTVQCTTPERVENIIKLRSERNGLCEVDRVARKIHKFSCH